MPVALVTDHAWPTLSVEQEVLAAVDCELRVASSGDEDELVSLVGDVDAILTCWKHVTARVLEAAPRCRIVSRYGIGLDNIDVEHATRLGIAVTNVPDYCVDEVAEHALALILAAARRVASLERAVREGAWSLDLARGAPRLRGTTLGLIGFGRIARELAWRARGIGLEVLAWTPRLDEERIEEKLPGGGVSLAESLDDLLERSDWVSVHAPLTGETAGLLGAERLARMRPTAWLVNTSRGAIVDEAALVHALDARQIAGAALDVLAEEPPARDHVLLGRDDVIITPHAAFYSETAIVELTRRAAQAVASVLRGERPADLVNPSVVMRE